MFLPLLLVIRRRLCVMYFLFGILDLVCMVEFLYVVRIDRQQGGDAIDGRFFGRGVLVHTERWRWVVFIWIILMILLLKKKGITNTDHYDHSKISRNVLNSNIDYISYKCDNYHAHLPTNPSPPPSPTPKARILLIIYTHLCLHRHFIFYVIWIVYNKINY